MHAATPRIVLAALLLAAPTLPAAEHEQASLQFEHGDWQLTCDNTRTCRADGYQQEDAQPAVSVLLTRIAGPGQAVTGKLTLGDADDDDAAPKLPQHFALAMTIDGRDLGRVAMDADDRTGTLSAAQVAALVASLSRKSAIAWSFHGKTWHLSGAGGAAILLKMDEFQGRLGSVGALIRKGAGDESKVLPALPEPVVVAVRPIDKVGSDKLLSPAQADPLRAALLKAVAADDCDLPADAATDPADRVLTVARLDAHKQLVGLLCWRGAYQEGYGYWVTNRAPPWNPVLVTTAGSDYEDGEIQSEMKGRGLGDCMASDTWTWDGKAFIHTASSTTGLCRLVSLGGTWDLPTLVTDVRHVK